MNRGGEGECGRIGCTIKDVEKVAEYDRTEGYEAPVCGKPSHAESFGYEGRKDTIEKAITHCDDCSLVSAQDQTIWILGNQLTSSDARNDDKQVRVFNTNRAQLGNAENGARYDETPETTHVKLFDNDI